MFTVHSLRHAHVMSYVVDRQVPLANMKAEYDELAKEASSENATYQQYLLRLAELEAAARAANALKNRIKQAAFPAHKDFETYEFSVMPLLNKQKISTNRLEGKDALGRTVTILVGQALFPLYKQDKNGILYMNVQN